MLRTKLQVLADHGWQAIKSLEKARLKAPFRGVPYIKPGAPEALSRALADMCPTGAVSCSPLGIDLGRCLFCGECARASEGYVTFTSEHRMAAFERGGLVVEQGMETMRDTADKVRAEIKRYFGRALRLREVCAGGDASTDMELNATMNVNFDFSRYGIEFVASPRHADGLVVTGPVTRAMAVPLEMCYDAVAEPKILIVAGTDAISGGLFAGSPAIDRSFFDSHTPDLWLPGNPVHPLTIIDGIMRLTGRKYSRG